MHRHFASVLALFPVLATAAHAQVHHEWSHTYDATPTGGDMFNAVAVAPSGSVYATGKTGTQAVLTLKYDPSGNLLWAHTFTFSSYIDLGYSIVVDPSDESVYAVGRCDQPGQSTGGLVLKYDALGNLLWSNVYHPSFGTAQNYTARLGANGHLHVGGGNGQGGTFAAEYGPQGNLRWSTTAPGGEYPSDITADALGNVFLAGTFDESGSITQFGVAKFAPDGSYLWTRQVSGGGNGHADAFALATDASGAVYAAGRLFDASGRPQSALVKLDPAGNVLWTRVHHGTLPGAAYYKEGFAALAFAANGNIRVAGESANVGTEVDIELFEYTPAGQLVWQDSWNGPANHDDNLVNLTTEGDGSVTVLAATEDLSGAYDPVVLRWDGNGTLRWAAIDPAPLGSALYSGAFGAGGVRVFAGYAPAASGSGTDTLVLAERDEVFAFCFGDGSSGPCPCSNQAIAGGGQGCVNSVGDAARLTGGGEPSLANDTLVLTSAGQVANSPSIFLQGSAQRAPAAFGDGLLCIGQNQLRLFVHTALGNAVSAPQGSDPTISARSAALGDPIASGTMRYYQVYYRDSTANFCPPPLGSSWNVSSGSAVLWVQ